METHHVSNPWQQQRQYRQDMFIPDPPNTFPLTDAETRSYDDFFHDRKKIFYQSKILLQRLQQQQQMNHRDQLEDHTEGDEDGETDSLSTTWSRLGMDSPSNQSSSTLVDSTTVLNMSDSGIDLEGDVLESLVQTLQSEVEDTQATVHDLEDRLNLAEHSNRHIIEELKMLLADAEATLRNAGKGNSLSSSGGKCSPGYEDSNIVYNRICIALQALIDEAQLALQKNSTKHSSSVPGANIQLTPSILRSSKKDGSRKERLKKKYQVQFLNPDVEGTNRQSVGLSTTKYRHEQQQLLQQQQPQYTSRSVGSTRSRGVVLQLYELWQQTWLRTRIMHVITGSVEIVIIIWVVIKASRMTLTWFGVQPSSVNQWITFIYGHRDSAGAGAKELYAKIRKDGLQMRQIKAWTRKEPVELVEDLVAGAAASTGLISPSSIVYGPAKRVMAHAATGIALAFFSDGARRLVRKL
ncbi:hypothetical protein BGX26_007540 [Mortierella sp. AD094]|nr:hypothetical protein BGX26_007540 [Mortierella sp. AD094]